MKKQSLSWLALLLAVVLSVGFASCKDDDDEEANGGGTGVEAGIGNIVGTWRYTFSSGYITFTFNADGTGSDIEIDHASENHGSNFSYVYDGEEGVVVILYDEGYTETYDVVFVNSNVMYLDGEKLVRQ